MKKNLLLILLVASSTIMAQQLPNAGFEDWSGEPFKNNPQPKFWNASNVNQFGVKFNFAHQEQGHSGKYCMMVQDQKVGVGSISEVSPGYFSLGKPWIYIENLFKVKGATAGTSGGIQWTAKPDSMVVWIKRTGENTSLEDFHLLYYAWKGESKGGQFKAKNGSCTKVEKINEESDIRQLTDGNECGTAIKATQVAEGWWHEKKAYNKWTRISVPIFYLNNETPSMVNVIFSASNYPNFRANSGLYDGNSLYIDDVEMVYSDKIQRVMVNGELWKEFNPNAAEQTYVLGTDDTMPTSLEFYRGYGKLTNSKGKTTTFKGRKLSASEVEVTNGTLNGAPTVVKVTSTDKKHTRTYKIHFVTAK